MTMKFAIAVIAAGSLQAATKIDVKTQTKNVDLSGALSVRPFRTGTVLPLVCQPGEMFFKTDATPGANSYGCTAADVWTLQGQAVSAGGGTATGAPLEVTRASNTELVIGAGCTLTAVCNVRIGSHVYSFTSPATATVTSGEGTVYAYVGADGSIVVGSARADAPAVTCTGCRAEDPVVAFPIDSIPLAFWHATASVWDLAGTDARAVLSTARTFTAGPNITITETGSNVTIAADSAMGSGTELQYRKNGKLGAVPSSSVNSGAVRLGAEIPANDALLTLGESIAAGNAAGTALAINAPAGFTGDLANWMIDGASLLKITAAGDVMLGGPAVTASTQVVIAAGAAQTQPLTQWVAADGTAGARISADGALQNLPSGPKPACAEPVRGMFWHEQGAAGVKDSVEVCAKDAADVYNWRALF
jgi:hypothetical protein